MAGKSDSELPRAPREKSSADKGTSGNREESMSESASDAYGKRGDVRDPAPATKADKSRDDEAAVRDNQQSSQSSGTESLGGETSDGADRKAPWGIEGHE